MGLHLKRADLLSNPDGVLFSLTCPDGTELGPFGYESAVDLQILKRERKSCLNF